MNNLIVAIAAYLIGSISFAVVVSRAMGLADPRSYGSGNPGATNVLRTGNKLAAILTLTRRRVQGLAAVWLVVHFGARFGLDSTAIALAAIAVFLGHLYPVFFRFQGGKGVATAAGVLLAIHPVLGLATLLTWLIIAFFFRYSSLAALVAAVFAPFFQVFLFGPSRISIAVAAMSALLIWRHRGNISKLLNGQESRIGEKKRAAQTAGNDSKRNEKAARGRLSRIPAGNVRSIAEIVEVERRVGHVLLQHRDGALQVVALRAGDAHRVALNARLHLDLAVLDQLDDLLRQVARHAFLDLDDLLQLVAADLLDLAVVEETHVHVALRQLREQHVLHLAELEVVVGEERQFALLLLDARVRTLEVEARGNFLVRLLDARSSPRSCLLR